MPPSTASTRRTFLRTTIAAGTLGLAGCDATDDICGDDAVEFESTVTDVTDRSLESRPEGAGWPLQNQSGDYRRVTDASGPRTNVGRFWRADSISPQAAIDDGRLYLISDDGRVLVADPATGEIMAEYDQLRRPRDVGVVGPPDNRTLIVTGQDGLHALTPDTSRRQFRLSGGDFFSIAGDDESVYTTGNRSIQAIDLASGSRRWRLDGLHDDGPIANGIVLADTDSGLRAYDTETGEVVWTRRNIYVYSSLCIADETVYAGVLGNVLALSLADGTTDWKFGGEAESFEVPAVTDDTIIAASSTTEGGGGNVYALDRATGEHRWCAALGYRDLGSAAVADGVAYVAGDDLVQARNISDGSILWTHHAEEGYYRAPLVSGDALYVPNENGWVDAFGEL
ncbi:PQQ-like beta-propeller repeat protein [Haloarcula sp. S1CR25-12]|uniref:PQQ-like beta-propeller repeat protein n=1 Tax=Haloarcula saliterrae TaxID=2950534 RepID=A0ABU2FFC6_9EURY|nr:PQQ-binding-like beta-propeller repeat protein [Haloarcula sp. S1CR25-12]MDS0260968.1 PQQ-like beta-propeller repeat protein [Haloarcula sp. S1CR25-12]